MYNRSLATNYQQMSGSYNRQKGHGLERDCVNQLKKVGFPRARTSRAASRLADDCKIDIVGVWPLAPQCKNMKSYASANELEKIDWKTYVDGTDGMEGRKMIPLLITKANNKETLAVLPWTYLLELLQLAHGN